MEKESSKNGGYLMQMQNFSVNDGTGIRTTVFLSGCPLRCQWCANPEGQTLINPMTRYVTVSEVMKEISRQLIFYRHSGGGVTFSGGEPTVQERFLRTLVFECYDMGISLALETCGYFPFDSVQDILEKMDCIFLDIKHLDEALHLAYTGEKNSLILSNIKEVAALNTELIIRIPAIVGVNATKEHLKDVFSFMKVQCPNAKLELLPYHTFGNEKYEALGLPLLSEAFSAPSKEQLKAFSQLAGSYGIEVVSFR